MTARHARFLPWLFGAPAICGLAMFVVLPFLLALILTFTDQRLVSPEPGSFVGLRNYKRLLSVSALVQSPEHASAGAPCARFRLPQILPLRGRWQPKGRSLSRRRPGEGASVPQPCGQLTYTRVRAITRTDPAYAGYRPLGQFPIGDRRITLLAKDPAFLIALGNTLRFALLVVPLQCAMALGLALLVNAGLRGQTIFRAIYFSPVVMSMVIVAVVWAFLFDKDLGLFNHALHALSFGAIQPVDWLGNPATAMPAIVIMSAWQGAGFQMLILLAGLQGISQELYDAARIDGAGAWQRFWYITMPGLRQTVVFVVIVTTIAALGLFTQVDVMTGGGPRGATATVMFEAVQRGVREQNIAYGATISVVYFTLIVVLILLQQWLQRRRAPVIQ